MHKEEVILTSKVQRIKAFSKGGKQEIINLGKKIPCSKVYAYLAEIGYEPKNIVGFIGL